MGRRHDLIIISAGSAGMSVTIYRNRTGLKTAMLEMGVPGGKLIKTAEISNWPDIIEANGAKLAGGMFEYSTPFGMEYLYGNITRVEGDAYKKIVCEDGTEHEARAVVVAAGTQERMMNVSGELGNAGHGVSYCTVCDGAPFRDQEVVIVGGSNSTLEETNYLTQSTNKANIIIRQNVFRANNIAQNVIKDNPKITMATKHTPVRVVDDDIRATGLVTRNVDMNVETEMKAHGILLYIGLDPATSFLEGLGILGECDYMIVDENCEAKAKGIYGVEDVIVEELRRVVTAINDGAITA